MLFRYMLQVEVLSPVAPSHPPLRPKKPPSSHIPPTHRRKSSQPQVRPSGLALALQCLEVLSGAGAKQNFNSVCAGPVPVAPAVVVVLACLFRMPWWHWAGCGMMRV